MPVFKLSGLVTISLYTEVEADTLEDAIEIAGERGIETYNWADKSQKKQVWVSDSFDGEVFEIEKV